MTDKQIRKTLGRISKDNVLEIDFIMSEDESPHRKALRLLAERQAALEEIAKEIGTGILIASLDEYAKKLKRVGEIARNATKGGK